MKEVFPVNHIFPCEGYVVNNNPPLIKNQFIKQSVKGHHMNEPRGLHLLFQCVQHFEKKKKHCDKS